MFIKKLLAGSALGLAAVYGIGRCIVVGNERGAYRATLEATELERSIQEHERTLFRLQDNCRDSKRHEFRHALYGLDRRSEEEKAKSKREDDEHNARMDKEFQAEMAPIKKRISQLKALRPQLLGKSA